MTQAEIDLPPALKKVLLEEHELLSQEARLPAPPHYPCIADILAQYVDFSTGQDYNSQAPEACILHLRHGYAYRSVSSDACFAPTPYSVLF